MVAGAGGDSSMLRGATIIEALMAAGVRDMVVAPGSRSAPLALAAAAAARDGRVRLHVRVDERSASYLALGLAKGSNAPVVVITTSGTAAVNVHPAIVEASYGGVPLIAVTADRPPRLRGVGANQTIEQAGIFGQECRFARDLVVPDAVVDAEEVWSAIDAATDPQHPGPVHINVGLDEPLVSTDLPTVALPPRSRPTPMGEPQQEFGWVRRFGRGLIVVGDTGGFGEAAANPRRIQALAEETGWPIISEPSGNASALDNALRHGPLVVEDEEFMADHVPDVIVSIGRVGLHRGLMRLLGRTDHHVVVDPRPTGYTCDPLRTAQQIVAAIPDIDVGDHRDPMWLESWRARDGMWALEVDSAWRSDDTQPLDGVRVARMVTSMLDPADQFVTGPSWPVRHVSAYSGPIRATTFANRGTSGIDGVISTAWGIASAKEGFTVVLLGDLTAIYDRNGLLAAPGEPHPHLAYVVIDNNGGGIFGELEQSDPAFAADYERVFGTPHGAELAALLSAPGVNVLTVDTAVRLREALDRARTDPRVHVIIATTTERGAQVQRMRDVSRWSSQ